MEFIALIITCIVTLSSQNDNNISFRINTTFKFGNSFKFEAVFLKYGTEVGLTLDVRYSNVEREPV